MRSHDNTLGITRKVYEQIEAFKNLGFDVTYSAYLEDGVAIFNTDGEIVRKEHYFTNNLKIQHIIRRKLLIKLCIDYFKTLSLQFDIVYLRYHFFDGSYIKLLKEAKKRSAFVVVESHSKPSKEKKISLMSYIYLKDSVWSKMAHRYVDLVAAMYNTDRAWGIRAIEFENGINIEKIKIHNPIKREVDKKEIHMISVAYESRVHGIDRVIRGINDYRKQGGEWEFVIHLVGEYLPSTKKLLERLENNEYILYGPLSGEKLDEVYDKVDIGIGSLGNHRNNSFYGSALKTKEYLAKGIPFIYGWREKILDDSYPYAVRFDLNEEPINMNEVVDFYSKINSISDLQLKIRNTLSREISWDSQMEKVIKNID